MADIYDYLKLNKDVELRFTSEKGDYISLNSKIQILGENKILIEPPEFNSKPYKLNDGTNLDVIIYTGEGMYIGGSSVISKELGTISGVWINYPLNSRYIQRREYLRIAIDIEIELIIYLDKNKHQKEILTLRTNDLSGRGLSFTTDSFLSDYYDIECSFNIPDEIATRISTRCEHIYSKKIHNKTKYLNALAFIDMDKDNVDRVVKFCFKKHLEQR